MVAGMVDAHSGSDDPEEERGERVVDFPLHAFPASAPLLSAGGGAVDRGKLAELMRCCDGLQELM